MHGKSYFKAVSRFKGKWTVIPNQWKPEVAKGCLTEQKDGVVNRQHTFTNLVPRILKRIVRFWAFLNAGFCLLLFFVFFCFHCFSPVLLFIGFFFIHLLHFVPYTWNDLSHRRPALMLLSVDLSGSLPQP